MPLFAGHPCEHHHYPFNSITPLLSSPIIPTPKSPHLLHNPLKFNLGFSGSCRELGSIQLRDAVKETKQLSKARLGLKQLSKICAIIELFGPLQKKRKKFFWTLCNYRGAISDFSPTLRHKNPVPSIELVSVSQTYPGTYCRNYVNTPPFERVAA